ncbi:MAG: hypothetical protein ACK5MJ_07785 [Alphaproteobacteria bacterium]
MVIGASVIAILPIAISSKSNSETGTLGVGAYIFVLFCLFACYNLSYQMRFNGLSAKFFYFIVYNFLLISVSAVMMGGAQSKRVGMYSLMACLIPVVMAIENNFAHKIVVRVFLYTALISATFLFSSSMSMLLT